MNGVRTMFCLVLALCHLVSAGSSDAAELVFPNSDFEQGSLTNWTAVGGAFTPVQPTLGDNPTARGRPDGSNHQGDYWIGTFEQYDGVTGSPGDTRGDGPTGTLTSVEFTSTNRYLTFLVGGGADTSGEGVRLLHPGGEKLLTAGVNSETMQRVSVDVSAYTGQVLRVQAFDSNSGGWGHINVDDFRSSSTVAGTLISAPLGSMVWVVDKDYLNIPIDESAEKLTVTISIDGERLGVFDTALATGADVDYYSFFDLSRFDGQTVTVTGLPVGYDRISLDDEIRDAADLYSETYRPQYHFTSRRGWLNDPNGLIYHNGVHHMYYQHNPVSVSWGNMTWGHAISTDLVHWVEQPKVLFPDPDTGACFSGAAFIDRWNQLGKQTGDEDVLTAFYLRTGIGLSLATSNDDGMTFTDYEGNPVLEHPPHRIDTPRPFWYEPTGRWIAPTYDHFVNGEGTTLRCVGIYSSTNLVDWEFESRVEDYKWGDELTGCVDFFELPVDGDTNDMKWVMIFIEGSYIVGDFDGHTFYTLEGAPAATTNRVTSLVYPGNYYATMTWHNMPGGRRVQVTWMNGGSFPGMPFSQQMTLPSELSLHDTVDGPRLRMNPIEELQSLRLQSHTWSNLVLRAGENPLASLVGSLSELEVEFQPVAGSVTAFTLRGIRVAYDADAATLTCGGVTAPLDPVNGAIRLQIYLDRTSIEVYGNDGRVYIPVLAIPSDSNHALVATCEAGEVAATYLRVHELGSAWLPAAQVDPGDFYIVHDFEAGVLPTGWTTTGTAFNSQPVNSTRHAFNSHGSWFLGTYENTKTAGATTQGDGPTGTVTGSPFVMPGNTVRALVGGGHYFATPGTECQLRLERDTGGGGWEVVRHETGHGSLVPDTTAAAGELMREYRWNVEDLVGETCRFVVVDNNSGGWGHINVDYIRVLNEPRPDRFFTDFDGLDLDPALIEYRPYHTPSVSLTGAGTLEMDLTQGTAYNLWSGDNAAVQVRYSMPQNRGFAVETRVLSRTYTGDGSSAGLVLGFVPPDANTIDDITYGAHGDNAGFQLEGPSLGSGVTYGGSGSVGYLRIRRHPDGVFDFERSSDGVSWTTDASHDFSSKTLLYVGLFSKCWNTHDPVVEFDYLDISIDQIPGTMLIVQ